MNTALAQLSKSIHRGLAGVLLTLGLALAATALARLHWLAGHGISVLTLAIVLGMAAGNLADRWMTPATAIGISFAKQTLLRVGIILYGLRLTFQDIANVGIAGIGIDALVLLSTFMLSWWAGTRLFGLDRSTALLVGCGSAICGAAAILAAEPVIRARPDQVTVAVSTVVVFGTVAMFLYPALYQVNLLYRVFSVSPAAYGLFAGSTIHEVAQVVAAGRAVSEAAANTAVIAKMVRVMMLAPFLVILSGVLSRRSNAADGTSRGSGATLVIPWFAVGFIAVAGVNSLHWLPAVAINAALPLDTLILAMAMAALGLTTRWSAIAKAGLKPMLLGTLLFAWLLGGGLGINALAALFSA